MKKLSVIVLISLIWLAFGAITSAEAMLIRVSQESSVGSDDFDDNVLGYIAPFVPTTPMTAANFYSFGNPLFYSYNGNQNGGPAPEAGLSQFFLVQASDGLALTVVHDTPGGIMNGNAQTYWELFGDTAELLVKDDATEISSTGSNQFTGTHGWVASWNDGYVIGSLDNDWSLFGQFSSLPTGIDAWEAVSSSGSSIALELDPKRRVRLDTVAHVPEPATMILFCTGLLGLAGFCRKKLFKK